MYSAGAGETALDRLSDDDPDPNSVYTRTLLPMLSTPGLDLREMAVEVRRRVNKLAQTVPHRQTPAYYDEVLNDFSFVPEEDADGLSKAIALQETVNDYLQTLKIGTPRRLGCISRTTWPRPGQSLCGFSRSRCSTS